MLAGYKGVWFTRTAMLASNTVVIRHSAKVGKHCEKNMESHSCSELAWVITSIVYLNTYNYVCKIGQYNIGLSKPVEQSAGGLERTQTNQRM